MFFIPTGRGGEDGGEGEGGEWLQGTKEIEKKIVHISPSLNYIVSLCLGFVTLWQIASFYPSLCGHEGLCLSIYLFQSTSIHLSITLSIFIQVYLLVYVTLDSGFPSNFCTFLSISVCMVVCISKASSPSLSMRLSILSYNFMPAKESISRHPSHTLISTLWSITFFQLSSF